MPHPAPNPPVPESPDRAPPEPTSPLERVSYAIQDALWRTFPQAADDGIDRGGDRRHHDERIHPLAKHNDDEVEELVTTERITLAGEQETMLMTLYLHARDAVQQRPVLGDQYAVPLLDRIDYDFGKLASLTGNQPVIVSRAKAIDDLARDFLLNHADAVVLHLGCGLDSRVLRLQPGPAVAWFDIDQAPAIDLRRRLIPPRPGTTMLATSVTDTGWWSHVPEGKPTLIVGEGLLMYLSHHDIATVIDNALSRRAPTQTLVFDTVAPWVRHLSKWQRNFRAANTEFRSTTADLTDAFARHSDTAFTQEHSIVTLARRATPGILGALVAAIDTVPAGHRAMILHIYQQHPA